MNVHRIHGVRVNALACAVPKDEFALTEYAPNLVDEKTARQIENISGFKSLRIAPDNITTSDLFCRAAESLSHEINNITALVFVTKTPDYISPATSHILQDRLQLPHEILCLDVNEGCSGFITGLYVASLIASQTGQSVLLGGGDTNSKLTSPDDRGTRCIFGDAGFAAVVSHDESSEIVFSSINYGEKSGAIIMENSRHRIVNAPKNDGYYFMDGAQVMNFALTEVTRTISDFMKDLNLTNEDIDLFACHQANKLMLSTIAKKLGVSPEKMPFIAENTGNTSSASIPLLLCDYQGSKSRVLSTGFGVGLSIGTCLADFSRTKFYATCEL